MVKRLLLAKQSVVTTAEDVSSLSSTWAAGALPSHPALLTYANTAGSVIYDGLNVFRYRELPGCNGLRLGGRVDGIFADNSTIVNIKKRTRRFYFTIPPSEMVQIMVYMFIFGAKQGIHMQVFDGDMRTETVQWDAALWDEIVSDIQTFTSTFLTT